MAEKTKCKLGHVYELGKRGKFCRTCARSRGRDFMRRKKQAQPHYKMFERYRMTPEDCQHLLDSQMGHCALCEASDGLELDHDHNCCPTTPTCGKCNRGFLCDRHNRGLGFFTEEELVKALRYVRGER